MSRDTALFGTDAPRVARRAFTAHGWSFTLENGALRHIHLHGVEAIRAIAFLVRDADWGTLSPLLSDETITRAGDDLSLRFRATFANGPDSLTVDLAIDVTAEGLRVSAEGRAQGDFETNRAGFTVLHPIAGVAGQPVRVDHGSGPAEDSHFPDLIAPWQPFMDITGLTHTVGRHAVTCAFAGDTFEMEDQRQWGDASFKTYNRPLAKPWPYRIADGTTLAQSVTLSTGPALPARPAPPLPEAPAVRFPQMALVLDPADADRLAKRPGDLSPVGAQRLLCHLDATRGETAAQFRAFARAQQVCPDVAYDLELICRCDADPLPELEDLGAQMQASGFAPDSILVCPSVDRQSTPPGSDWPACPPLDVVHRAAAKVFPHVTRGGGMVSLFTELNRKRPPLEHLSFVSHGLCPIVHAADDLSVMETLEAVPHITRSARAIIGERAYRIGPATIAMRQNPYGSRTMPNPDGARICMTDDDPRHRAKFGAAYVIGLATALAPADVAVWTPAALYGPRGVVGDDARPITEALRALARLAGEAVSEARIVDGRARLRVGRTEITADLTVPEVPDTHTFDWSVRDL